MKDYCHYSTKYVPNPYSCFGPLPNNMLIRSRPVGGGHCGLGSLGHSISNPEKHSVAQGISFYGPLPLPPVPPSIRHFELPKPGSREPALTQASIGKSNSKSASNSSEHQNYDSKWDRYTKNWKKSLYHGQCLDQPWVPSPAKTTKRSKSSHSPNKAFPLCLVCDRDYGYFEKDGDWCVAGEESSADYLFRKFQKNADRLLELDREAREHAERQKRKVLQELWAMHHGGGGETTRPRSANAMYDYKSKSKYDHLVYPDREKSKFHDRCDDSDWRPEKKAWVPEEIKNRKVKDADQLQREKEYRQKSDHLMHGNREPSKYHTRCEDTDYRPEKKVWIPEEVIRQRHVKDEEQLRKEKEYRDKSDHLMYATREPSKYHDKCEDTDYRPEKKVWSPEVTRRRQCKDEEQLRKEAEYRQKSDHLMYATREPSKYHDRCDDTDYRPEKKVWSPEVERKRHVRDEEQMRKDAEYRQKSDHLMYATREPSKYHDRCDDTDYRPEKKVWTPEIERKHRGKDEEQLRKEAEYRQKSDHLMYVTKEPSKYHDRCDDPDYRPEKKTWVSEETKHRSKKEEKQIQRDKENRAKYDHLMIATREPSKYHEKCDDPDYKPEKKTWVPPDKKDDKRDEAEGKLKVPTTPSKKQTDKYDHLMSPTREKSKYHDKCDDPDYKPEKKTWVPPEKQKEIVLKKLYEMANTQPATQSMPTIPSEKQRGSSVIIVGKNPNACQDEQKDENDKTWEEIFQSNSQKEEKRESSKSKSSSANYKEMDDLDLIPDKDWSLSLEGPSNGKQTRVEIHSEPKVIDDIGESIEDEKNRTKVKAAESTHDEDNVRNVKKHEYNESKYAHKAKRNKFKEQKSRRTIMSYSDSGDEEPKDMMREFVDMSFDRDIMKEFVDQSFEREDNIQKASNENNKIKNRELRAKAMKQDLVECLDMIERSVNGKIIDANGEGKNSNLIDETHENDSTNVSLTLKESSSGKRREQHEAYIDQHNSAKSDSPPVRKQQSSFAKSDQDIFIELIIDELKRENREIKFTLAAREDKLEHAASRVSEMVEQNTLLSNRLELVLQRAEDEKSETREKIERYENTIADLTHRIQAMEEAKEHEVSVSKISADELQGTLRDLRRKLEESEAAKENLQSYINHLKSSYQSVFGNDNSNTDNEISNNSQPPSVSHDTTP